MTFDDLSAFAIKKNVLHSDQHLGKLKCAIFRKQLAVIKYLYIIYFQNNLHSWRFMEMFHSWRCFFSKKLKDHKVSGRSSK